MKILLVTQYFYPEIFRSNDIAFEFVRKGYDVDVLTSIPNYPIGKYFQGYGILKKRREKINGVNVYRVFQTPRGLKHSGLKLALNYCTYAFFSLFWVLWFSVLRKKYKAIIVHQTSPITQALPAILLGKIKRVPVYTWVLDIWPDAMRSGGGFKNEKIISIVDKFVQWVYRRSRNILISSENFRELVNRKANYDDKIIYFPNWCDDLLNMPNREDSVLLPNGFRIMMAGNLGSAQDIRNVMKTIYLLKWIKEIYWIFVGDGSEKAYIEEFVEDNKIDNVILTGKRPFEEMPAYFKQADVMLLTLRAEFPHLKAVVPARLQSYMSAGKPVLGMVDGGSASIINKSKCGICANAADYKTLADNIVYAYEHQEDIKNMGVNGRLYYEDNFTMQKCLDNLEKIIINNGK